MNWDGLNRRKFPRANFPCLVTLRYSQEKPEAILAHTENVGMGGVCVIVKRPVKLFTPVDVEIDLLDAEAHIKCSGKVVWCVQRRNNEIKKPSHYDVGVEFVALTEDQQKHVQQVIEHLVSRNGQAAFRGNPDS